MSDSQQGFQETTKVDPVLDERLVARARRKPREDILTNDECVAVNLFWRRHVPVPILARVFKSSKNTLYYRAITGTADSYPTSLHANNAKDTNELIERMGEKAAWKKYVTQDMVDAVHAELQAEIKRRAA